MRLRMECEVCGQESEPQYDTGMPLGWAHVRVVHKKELWRNEPVWTEHVVSVCRSCYGGVCKLLGVDA